MFDSATTNLLRAVLDDVCAEIPRSETNVRTHVAAKLLECAGNGERSIEALRNAGKQALGKFPRY